MKQNSWKKSISRTIFSIILISLSMNFTSEGSIPTWVKNTALWCGESNG